MRSTKEPPKEDKTLIVKRKRLNYWRTPWHLSRGTQEK